TVTGAAGGSDCTGCHQGDGIPGSATINMTLFNQTPHVNINGGNATNSMSCWECHGNGSEQTESDHIINANLSLVKTCTNSSCHGNTSSPESRFNIISHSPTSGLTYVRTDAASADCDDCHAVLDVLIYNSTYPGTSGNSSMVLRSGPVAHYIKDITDNATDKHYVIDSVGWGVQGSQGCVFCHKTANGTVFNATPITHGGTNCYGCHIVGTTTLHDQGVINASQGGRDCVLCHGESGGMPDINVSAFNSSVHADLNSNNAATGLTYNLSKACWACHGNGSDPGNQHPSNPLSATNPANTTYPLDCTDGDCHVNGTPTGSTFDDPIPNTTEHIPFGLSDDTDITTPNNCSASCHLNSLTPHIEPINGTRSETDLSNVSHYGNITSSNISKVQNPTGLNCVLCHKNTTNNATWGGATQMRHPVNKTDDFCQNCHGIASTFHRVNISTAGDIHDAFDWEADGADYYEDPPINKQRQDNEGCYACHEEKAIMGSTTDANTMICEECHYNTSVGPFNTTNISMRSDVNATLPRVFNHINDSSAVVVASNMSQYFNSSTNITSPSSCYAYNVTTGEGTCHGVNQGNNSSGYYAFYRWDTDHSYDAMSPYRWTTTIDRLPNTTDCRICHLGANSTVGIFVDNASWGYPMNVTSTKPTIVTHTNATAQASDCWSCHVIGGVQPFDFHDVNITG
ncbi:MAG: hypothetical protein M8353_11665, partial [ANME-2 cluster archaeon]|nr:hypothetical protein [ANME-2 cluster archaeon]